MSDSLTYDDLMKLANVNQAKLLKQTEQRLQRDNERRVEEQGRAMARRFMRASMSSRLDTSSPVLEKLRRPKTTFHGAVAASAASVAVAASSSKRYRKEDTEMIALREENSKLRSQLAALTDLNKQRHVKNENVIVSSSNRKDHERRKIKRNAPLTSSKDKKKSSSSVSDDVSVPKKERTLSYKELLVQARNHTVEMSSKDTTKSSMPIRKADKKAENGAKSKISSTTVGSINNGIVTGKKVAARKKDASGVLSKTSSMAEAQRLAEKRKSFGKELANQAAVKRSLNGGNGVKPRNGNILYDEDSDYDSDDSFVAKDEEQEDADMAGTLRSLFGYDKRDYADIDTLDTADMEVGFDVISREERRSTKIARQEDLEEEELEKKRNAKRMAKLNARKK